jgi:hypothetical protein
MGASIKKRSVHNEFYNTRTSVIQDASDRVAPRQDQKPTRVVQRKKLENRPSGKKGTK